MKIRKNSFFNNILMTTLTATVLGSNIIDNSIVSFASPSVNSPDYTALSEDSTSKALQEIKAELDLKGRDFNPQDYIQKLRNEFIEATKGESLADVALAIELISKVISNSGNITWASEFKDSIEKLKESYNINEFNAFLNIHLIKMSRILKDDDSANKFLKEGISLATKAKNPYLESEMYYVSAMDDVIDLHMNTNTFKNLELAIKIAEETEDFPKRELIKYYTLQSQVYLYFKKDPSSASDLLGKALVLSHKNEFEDLELRVKELQTAIYPFFFKYDEGIAHLKPLVDERIENGQNLEAVVALDKLINMYFDSGNFDEALKLGPTLRSLIDNVNNPLYKEYFNDYTEMLYTVNELFIDEKYEDAIDLIKSKDFNKYSSFISIDESVINLFLGNLYTTIGDKENALSSFQAMFEALANNSDENEYVYTDTSMSLASAYASLDRYKEAYETLQKHLDVFVGHQMNAQAKESEKLNKMYANEKEKRTLLENRVFMTTTISLCIIITLALYDIYKSRKYNKVLAGLSVTDSLTGLSNRRALDEFLTQRSYLLDKFANNSEPIYVSAIMLDIDNFKTYNDNYGHTAGDKVLEKVGSVLKKYTFCDSDIVARYGGEEFTVILMDHDSEKAIQVSEVIRADIEELAIEHKYSTCTNIVTTSIGISTKDILSEDFESIITEADKALYFSKENGKNRVTHFNQI